MLEKVKGGGGDAVDRVGGRWCTVVTATRRLFAWSERVGALASERVGRITSA